MNSPYIAANAVIEAAVRAGSHSASVNMLAMTVDGTRMVILFEGRKRKGTAGGRGGDSPSPSVSHHTWNDTRGRSESIDDWQEVYRVFIRDTIKISEDLDVEVGDKDRIEHPYGDYQQP